MTFIYRVFWTLRSGLAENVRPIWA